MNIMNLGHLLTMNNANISTFGYYRVDVVPWVMEITVIGIYQKVSRENLEERLMF